MVDLDILKHFGSTNERLREVFTAQPNADLGQAPRGETKEAEKVRLELGRKLAKDLEVREKLRRTFQTRVEEGIVHSLRHWRMYAAVDLAWDTNVITRDTLPLLAYAQGKINVERAQELLGPTSGASSFIKKDEQGKAKSIDLPKFVETQVNLVKKFISRRHAAQKVKYNQLWPFYKYEPRSTGQVAKCRADVLSQRMDIMADQFNYRHHDSQCIRDAMLYGHCLDFIRTPWEVHRRYDRKDVSKPPEKENLDSVVEKEGVSWWNPHISRVFWDNSFPLSSINSDTGCQWVGYWDVLRFSVIDDSPLFFNKTAVGWTGRFWGDAGVYNTYRDYFTHYQYTIIPPATGEIDPSKANDRMSQVGFYSGNQRDAAVFVANIFWKMTPKDWGIGEYPYPTWVWLVNASDSTVVHAEFLSSSPAAYLGINESDGRQVNTSMGMDLMGYQDQMTNLLIALLLVCQIETTKIVTINTDVISERTMLDDIRAQIKSRTFYGNTHVIEVSLVKLAQTMPNVKLEKLIEVAETHQGMTINSIFEAMLRLMELAEKLEAFSPAEQGQPAPREITATEVNEISNTTSAVYSAISDDVDEYKAAKKRICYESTVTRSVGDVNCPVKDRYSKKTIEAAGFKTKQGEDEDYQQGLDSAKTPRRYTVIGSPRMLVHDYIFTSRDGSERPVNSQAANTLVQLMNVVLSTPPIAQALGREKLYEIFNEIFRMSGAGVDLNLSVREGEGDSLGEDELKQMQQSMQQLQQALQQIGQQTNKNAKDIQAVEQMEETLKRTIEGVNGVAERGLQNAKHIDEIRQKHEDIQKRLVESIPYDKCPPSIQRQMEQQAGFEPAPDSERIKPAPKTNGKN